ncbi:MAG: hypothetical protein ACLQG5_13645 [Methanobacterium sp.]|jgi:hypothetical protein
MQFDYTLILILLSLSTLTVIFIIKLIYRHNPHYDDQYGKEIVLFHSTERYKKRVWRFNLIEKLKNQKIKGKIIGELELKVIVGEFSEGTQEIVKHAANHKFNSITIISGPKVFCEDRMEIYTLLDKYKSVEYLILPKRPLKHFMIFNKTHLFIEKPHRHNHSRGSVGVMKAQPKLVEIYDQAFNEMLEYAHPLTKYEVMKQECYIN